MTNRDKIKCLCNIAENFDKTFDVKKIYEAYKEELSYTCKGKKNSSFYSRAGGLQGALDSGEFYPDIMKYFEKNTNYRFPNDPWNHESSSYNALMSGISWVASDERIHYWADKKIVYNFTKEMKECLLSEDSIKSADNIPINAFDYLPYDSFFICLDQSESYFGDLLSHNNSSEILGILITKRTPLPEERPEIAIDVIFTDPDCIIKSGINMRTLNFFIDQAHVSLKDTIVSMYKEEVKLYTEFHKNQKIAKVARDYSEIEIESLQQDLLIEPIIAKYIPLVLYLAAENAQIKEVKPPKEKKPLPNKGKLKNIPQKTEPKKFIVGEEFAINYRKYQAARSSSSKSSSDGTSYTMAPHARKAHWHHFWKGSDVNPEKNGPRRLVLQFVEETFIHKELKEMVRPTVISVDSSSKADSDITDISEEDEKDL